MTKQLIEVPEDIEFEESSSSPAPPPPPPPPPQPTLSLGGRIGLMQVVALTVLADFLFWKQPLGWSVSLFGLSLCVLFVVAIHSELRRNWMRVAGPVFVLLLSIVACVLHRSMLGLVLGIGGVIGVAVAAQYDRFLSVLQWLAELVKFWLYAAILSIYDICGHLKQRHPYNPRVIKIIKTWAVAVSLAAGFLFLFSMANPILEGWLNKLGVLIGKIDINIDFTDIGRAGHFLLFFLFLWALLRYRSSKSSAGGDIQEPPTLPVSFTDVCLILFNIVFALQSVLDIGYLFSGVELPEQFTYAEYAHRGFYPLWVASMVAAGFMLLFWSDDPKKYPPSRLRNVLLYVWIGQNALLLYSAIYRMHLYICAYSLSLLRVAALTGMVLVSVGLAGITWRIVRRKPIGWLLNMNGIAVVLVLLVLALVNVPSRVAWFNVRHCKENSGAGVALDIVYLRTLGPDALPALVQFERDCPECSRITLVRSVVRYLHGEFERERDNWRGWTVNRSQIKQALLQLPETGEYAVQRNPVFDREKLKIKSSRKISRIK